MPPRWEAALRDGSIRAFAIALLVGLPAAPSAWAIGPDRPEPSGADVPPRPLPLECLPPVPFASPEVRRASADASEGPQAQPTTPVADAGDDQIGLVGRQITLNGVRSKPRDGLGFRWFQLGGPKPVASSQDRHFLTFTPPEGGVYRFGLVVASGSLLSELDTVDVLVGTLPPTAPGAAPPLVPAPTPVPALAMPVDEFARTALATLDGGPAAAEPLASTFEAISGRMDLYRTYADVFSEMSRRLDATVPQDPAQRDIWVQRLFAPMTARLVEQLRTEGLDLARPDGPGSPMTAAQKAKLGEMFLAMSKGFRAALPAK